MPLDTAYSFDPTGLLASNLVTNENHILTPMNFQDYHFVVPKFAPFFAESLVVRHIGLDNVLRTLTYGVDYLPTHWFIAASRACAKPIYGSVSLMNLSLAGTVIFSYQTLGGDWLIDTTKIAEITSDRLRNPRITAWDVVAGLPAIFPPIDHEWDLQDMVGLSDILPKLTEISAAIVTYQTNGLAAYKLSTDAKVLAGWAYAGAWRVVTATYNTDGAMASANIQWPDGSSGIFTADAFNATYPELVDAWHATYAGVPTRLVTQAAVTRDSDGNMTAQPAITVV